MSGTIRKADLVDIDFLDAPELESDGTSVYLSGSITSVVSGLLTVSFTPDNSLFATDNPVEAGDLIHIGSGAIAGWYTIAGISSDYTFTVVESISGFSGSAAVDFIYPAGASRIGFSPKPTHIITDNTVEGAFTQLDQVLTAGALGYFLSSAGINLSPSWVNHDTLRKAVHLWNGPFEGFSGAYQEVVGSPFPTSATWYTSSAKTNKIIEKDYTYNTNKTISVLVWKVYDLSGSVITTITETRNYTGPFLINRTRTIT